MKKDKISLVKICLLVLFVGVPRGIFCGFKKYYPTFIMMILIFCTWLLLASFVMWLKILITYVLVVGCLLWQIERSQNIIAKEIASQESKKDKA